MKTTGKMKTGIELIAEERQRQVKENYLEKFDSGLHKEQLAYLAACYTIPAAARGISAGINGMSNILQQLLPPPISMWKPTPEDRIKELQKAGALIAAEIDRLNRIKE